MDMAQTLALAVTGVVLVPFLQMLKRYMKLEGPAMLWVSLILSWAIAIFVVVATGKISLADVFNHPGVLFGSGGIVITITQAVYGSIKKQMNLSQHKTGL